LATLLAVDVKRNILNPIINSEIRGQPFRIKVITFGQPRVGNDIFAYILKQEFFVKTGGLNHTVARYGATVMISCFMTLAITSFVYICVTIYSSILSHIYSDIINSSAIIRMVHQNDLVAHLPPADVGFMHNSHEIWVRNKKEVYDCEDFEGKEVDCADWTLFYDMTVHLYIWDIHFGPYC